MQAHRAHLPDLEGVREHEPLHLGVRAGPDRVPAQPGVADLAGVGTLPGMAVWPRPAAEVEEPGRADHRVVSGSASPGGRPPGTPRSRGDPSPRTPLGGDAPGSGRRARRSRTTGTGRAR